MMSDSETDTGVPLDATETDETVTGEVTTPGTELDAAETDSADDLDSRNREAAKYRRKLRDLEITVAAERELMVAERDALTVERGLLAARLDHMQRGEVERLAADTLADPSDLWRETDLEDLLDQDGNIDTGKVAVKLNAVVNAHPHWRAV